MEVNTILFLSFEKKIKSTKRKRKTLFYRVTAKTVGVKRKKCKEIISELPIVPKEVGGGMNQILSFIKKLLKIF